VSEGATSDRGLPGAYPGPFHGSRTTHIFCLPTCRHDVRVLEKNRVVFDSVAAAKLAGYRACKVCRPASADLQGD
jgi:methylphosphotriester-DNA--protein-cysteine methyltransferase